MPLLGYRPRLTVLRLALAGLFACYGGLAAMVTNAGDWSGRVGAELRAFTAAPLDSRQADAALSLSVFAEPQFFTRWNKGADSLAFVPFLRWDQYDEERSHADIRELSWVHASREWELRTGIRKVFWGVTESQHLVDIINQTDLVENIDGEEKLGQPMINLALIRDWGTVDLFLLPGFRERNFPGTQGRLRPPLPIEQDLAQYASEDKARHVDAALRWDHYMGAWDLGLSHFSGTSREPRLLPGLNARGEPVLIPRYDLIDQTGLDLQLTRGAWLWKLEAIRRVGQGPTYSAATGGFEYTLAGPFQSAADLGLVAEYLYDERGKAGPSPFQNDIMLGVRVALNDIQGTELLAAAILDHHGRGSSYSLEASRRLGDSWRWTMEARVFSNQTTGVLSALRNEDYIQTELLYYY